jgi:hypothetical protein
VGAYDTLEEAITAVAGPENREVVIDRHSQGAFTLRNAAR